MFTLKDKNAIVTGGGSGIGRAISLLFAQRGAHVHIMDMDKHAADSVADEINEAGLGRGTAYFCNVADQQQVISIVREIATVDILINNAGISHIGKVENTSEEDFDRVYNVNVKGAYNLLYACIPAMSKRGGAIVNMASIASHVGLADRFAYSMSKGAIYAMTLSVAKDYLPLNIRCNSISPARVHTPFVDGFIAKNYPGKEKEMFERLSNSQPIKRMANPEEIASLALYLVSDEAEFITGNDYPIDGGFIKLNN